MEYNAGMRFSFLREEKFYHATGVLVATMIGAGMYGIPFVFAKSGFWVGVLWLVGLACVTAFFDLLFAELTLSTQGTHQVTGYIKIWLGPWGHRVSMVAQLLSLYGALLAYIIVMGDFLHAILSNYFTIDPQWYSILFALAAGLLWLFRIKTIARVELILIGLSTGIVLLITLFWARSIRFEHFSGWTPEFWYLPYGVLLFSLAGVSAIPIQRELLKGREHLFRPAIASAIGFTVGVYLLFAVLVVGISGDATSPSAITGLYDFLGAPAVLLGSLLGILTVSTAYIMLGTALLETFHVDYRQRTSVAWLLAVTPPLFFFIGGLRNFIDIIGLVGAVALGTQSVLLLIAYVRARRTRLRDSELKVRAPLMMLIACGVFFVSGAVFELLIR